MVIAQFLYHLAALVAVSVISGFVDQRWKRDTLKGSVTQGLLFGSVAILGMMIPFVAGPGLIFDGRSVILSLCGLFFGPLSVTIAAVMAIAYRIFEGGPGAVMGVSVITASAAIGIIFYYDRIKRNRRASSLYLLGFGIIVHVVMLMLTVTLPRELVLPTLQIIGLPVIITYPVATILIGKILYDQEQNLLSIKKLKESELRWKYALEGAGDGVWDWDIQSGWNYFSPRWKEMIGYEDHEIENNYTEWEKRVHPDDLPKVLKDLDDHLKGKTPVYQTEFRFRRKDGSYMWILDRGKVIERSADGKPLRFIGTHIDIDERKRNERQLEAIADNITGPAARVDRRLQYTFASAWFERAYGMTPDTVIGSTMPAVMGEVNFEKVRYYGDQALQGIKHTFEYELELPGGREIYEITYIPDRDAEHNVIGFFIVGTDITERRRTEEELKESEQRFRSIVEGAPDPIFIQTDLKFAYVNPRALELFDIKDAEELIGQSVFDRFHPDFREKLEQRIHTLNVERKPVNEAMELKCIRLDKSEVWVEIKGEPITYEGKYGALVFVRDIQERKRMEESLRQSEVLMHIAGRLARLGGWRVNLAENQVIWSEEVADIHEMPKGFSPTVEEGLNFYAPAYKKKITEVFKACAQDGVPYEEVLQIITKNGKRVWVRTIGVPLRNEAGEIVSVQGGFQDISEQVRAEEEIKKLNAELEQRIRERTAQLEAANKELEAFAYSVSHDLRAPLRSIDGFSRFLFEDYAECLDDEGKRLLNVIRSNTHKMDQLITDLLALSRVTRSTMDLNRVDMKKLVESIYYEVTNDDVRNMFQVVINSLPDTRGDSILLRQVWQNLLTNAVKYSMKSNTKKIEIGAKKENNRNIYYIKDYGAGFNPKYKHQLFNVFQRLHRTEEFEGTGVGLAIVQRIIHRHGGEVWAESEIDKGATFYFSIPREGNRYGSSNIV